MYPSLETLSDDFTGSSLNTSLWSSTIGSSGSIVVSGGLVKFVRSYITTVDSYEFGNFVLIVKNSGLPTAADITSGYRYAITLNGFNISGGSSTLAEVTYGPSGQTTYTVFTSVFSSQSSSIPMDPVQQEYIKIEFINNIFTFYDSPDGLNWSIRFIKTLGSYFVTNYSTRIKLSLGLGVFGPTTGFNYVNVDGVNTTPITPITNFVGTPLSGSQPLNVSFTDKTLGGPTSWLWDFGDGGTSTLRNPTHIYSSIGSFTVSLTATNSSGSDNESKTDYITTTAAVYTREAKGTLTFSGGAERVYIAVREASGTLMFSGSAFAIRISDPSVIEKKTYLYKVYDEDNDFLGVWDDVVSDPNWSEELNTAGSSHTVILARNSDSLAISNEILLDSDNVVITDSSGFDILTSTESRSKVGPGSNVNHNYRVDIFVFYGEAGPILDSDGVPITDSDGEDIEGTIGAPNGRRIFTGFISEINTKYGDTENTEVQLMSYGFDLDQYPVVNMLGETTVAFNSYDPAEIVRDGIDQFTLDGINTFTTYSPSTVQNTGTTVSYTFRANTYKELLDKALQLAPSNYFYYIDLGSNLINFLPKPTTANHLFYLGKHIKALNLRSYIGDTVNDVIFTGGGDPALYRRTTRTPITGTRRGLSRISDNRVTLDTSADILAEGELDSKENIQYRSTIQILDRTYDLESINLGDMVGFRNFDNYVDTLLMQIVAKDYTPDVLTLQLDTLPQSVPKRLEELRKALNTQETTNVPDTPA